MSNFFTNCGATEAVKIRSEKHRSDQISGTRIIQFTHLSQGSVYHVSQISVYSCFPEFSLPTFPEFSLPKFPRVQFTQLSQSSVYPSFPEFILPTLTRVLGDVVANNSTLLGHQFISYAYTAGLIGPLNKGYAGL